MLGTWWASASHDACRDAHQVPGQIILSKESWTLTTVGSLRPDTDSPPLADPALGHVTAIHGKDQQAKAVSLLDLAGCGGQSMTFSPNALLSGVSSEQWVFNTYAIGNIHVDEDVVASRVEVSIDGLSLWANGTRDYPHSDESALTLGEVGSPWSHFSNPEPWEAFVSYDDVAVGLSRGWSASYQQATEFRATQDATFTLDGHIQLGHIRDQWVDPLRRFVAFWTMGPVRVTNVTAHVEVPTDTTIETVEVVLHFRDRHREPEHGVPRTVGVHWIASLDELVTEGVPYETLMSRWLQLGELYHASASFLMDSADASLPLDRQLLAGFMGIETYHEARYPNEYPPGRWPHYSAILKRVEGLTGSTQRLLSDAYPDLSTLAKECRNTAAHGTRFWRSDYVHEWLLGRVWLQWTLRHLILDRLGFSEAQIEAVLSECFRFRQDVHYLKGQYPGQPPIP